MAKKLLKYNSDHDREAAADLVLRHQRKSLSDIVPAKKRNTISFIEEARNESGKRAEDKEELASEGAYENDENEESNEASAFLSGDRVERFSYKKWAVFASLLLLLVTGIYLALFVLPKADIILTLKTSPWPKSGSFSGDISAMLSGGDIPAQLQSYNTNLQSPLVATSKKLI